MGTVHPGDGVAGHGLPTTGLTGETPSNFFRTYKLNRAAELLKSGKYTVAEVADKCGFSTQSHFSVVFKKQFGVTPTEYKE